MSIEQNATSTKNLGKINGKVKYGLVEELRNSVKEAASYICEAKNHFADIQSTVVVCSYSQILYVILLFKYYFHTLMHCLALFVLLAK